MLKKLKHTISSTAIYSFGNALTKLIGIVLLPLYTNELTTAEYGTWAIFETISLILASIFAFNIPTALLRWCAQEKDKLKEKQIIFSSFLFLIISAGSLLIITYPNSNIISKLFWPDENYIFLFQLIFISVFFEIINKHPISIIRLREKQFLYVGLTAVRLVIILSFNIYFILEEGRGVDGIILSRIIGQVFFFLMMIPTLIKNITLKFEKKSLIGMLKYGTPLILTTLSNYAFSQSDKFIIPLLIGESSLGIYNVGLKYASIMNMFLLQAFSLGFLPIAFKMFDQPGYNRYFSKIMTYYTMVLVVFGLALSIFGLEIIEIFIDKKEYWVAYNFIPLLVLGFILRGMNQMFILGFHYKKTTKKLAIIVFFGAVLSIGFNILFLPVIGLYAAPLAVIISMVFMNTFSLIQSDKLLKINYEYRKLTILILTGMGLYIISLLLNEYSMLIRVFTKSILLGLFPFILLLFNFYEPIEIERIKQISKKWNQPSKWKSMLRND